MSPTRISPAERFAGCEWAALPLLQSVRQNDEIDAVPVPPEPCVVHEYTLLQTTQVIGREAELMMLDSWVSDPAARFASARVLCIVAIGGMGKSALAWKWFHQRAAEAMKPLDGSFWWSFYEADAGFDRFIIRALAYCSGRTVEVVEALSPVDREHQLLALVDRKSFLLVLDGLERVLIAYSSLDFAHLVDEDLDERTLNKVAGAWGLPEEARDTFIRQHRLRKTIDPRVGNFLRKLAKARMARMLVTTRLFPADLQTITGHELPQTAAWFLRGMEKADALALWREMGVSDGNANLEKLFTAIDHYPLLIRALAGEVASHRPAPGNFDAWQRAHRDFDPFSLPLVKAKSHVLAHALGNISEEARDLLQTVAAFRSPVDYDTLAAMFVHRRRWPETRLDAILTELEDRGLLGWDRGRSNRYDLHPIVRGVVWSGLDQITRKAVYGTLERHFSVLQAVEEAVGTLEEATPVIELFNVLVGLGRFESAANLYFDRIQPGAFTFADAGIQHVNIAMLESLFPKGLDRPPKVSESLVPAVLSQLGYAYQLSGRLTDAREAYSRALVSGGIPSLAHRHISEVALPAGHIREALDRARAAIEERDSLSIKYDVAQHMLCEATMGKEIAVSESPLCFEQAFSIAQYLLWQGRSKPAANLARRYTASRHSTERISMALVLAEAGLSAGELAGIPTLLANVLREARAKNLVEPELRGLRCLAELYRRLGQYAQSRSFLEDLAEPAARGPYRLIQAEAALVLAELERDCGNYEAATAAVIAARAHAWCDGPPYAYHCALDRAQRLLAELSG